MTDPTTAGSERGGAHASAARYYLVWGVLMMLTAVTVLAARVDMGRANIVVALAIAVSKATLVALFFMHLWDGQGVNRTVFAVSVIFVCLLAFGTVADFATRLPAALPPGIAVPPLPAPEPTTGRRAGGG